MESTTPSRRIISIVLFVLAVIFVLLGLLTDLGVATGVLLGVAAAIVGIIFYRRGK